MGEITGLGKEKQMIFTEIFCPRYWRGGVMLAGFIMLVLNIASFGQEMSTQTDTLKIGEEYIIEKRFEYNISQNDTILNGNYALRLRPELAEGLQERFYDFGQLEVSYQNDQMEGAFFLQSVSLQPALHRLSPAVGYIQLPFSGTIYKNEGQFEEDFPVGRWSFLQLERDAGSLADTTLQLQAFFGNRGVLRDRYRISDRRNAVVIAGMFNTAGALNDVLNVRSREDGNLLLSIDFEDGLLMAVNRAGAESLRADYHANISEMKFVEQPLDSLYPKIMSYYLDLPEGAWEEVLRPLRTLSKSFRYLTGDFSPLMDYLPGDPHFQPPLVKVPVYETTEEEQEIVLRKHERIQELNRQINGLMNASAFALNRSADQQLSSLYARLQEVKNRLDQQQQFSETLAGPLLPHIDPEWFIERRLTEVEPLDTAVYTYNGQQFREPMNFTFATEGMSAFEQYRSYITVLEEKYIMLSSQVSQLLAQVELDTKLTENEKDLSRLSVEIEQLADSIALNMYSEEISNQYQQNFVDFKDFLLKEYAAMGPQERNAALEGLVSCFERMKDKLKNAHVLAGKEKIVDEAYMGTHLNPYTYTEEDERIFEGLFSAYRDTLVPFLVNNMTDVESCEAFLERVNNLESLQEFMLNALNENPRRMERRIRKIDDPQAIIRRLEIPVNL